MNGIIFFDDAIVGCDATMAADSSDANSNAYQLKDECPFSRWAPGTYNIIRTVAIDLLTPQTIVAMGIVNHNLCAAICDSVTIRGSANGSTWTTVTSFTSLSLYDHDPTVAKLASATYRYWQFMFAASTYRYWVGGLFLARQVYTFGETPDEPFGRDEAHQIVDARTESGNERRQKRGERYHDRSLQWKRGPKTVADAMLLAWSRQRGQTHPFLYSAHDSGDPTTPKGYYTPEYVRFTGMRPAEKTPGGRYSIDAGLRALV